MSDLVLRQAVPEDSAAISALIRNAMLTYCRESGISSDVLESMSESVESVRFRICNNLCLCYFDNGEPVATITLTLCKEPMKYSFNIRTEKYLSSRRNAVYISRYAVKDDFRGTGLGILLMNEASAYAKKEGADCLLLHTAVSNKVMRNFYANRGFVLIDSEKSRGYERGLFSSEL